MAEEEKKTVVYRIDDAMRIVLLIFAIFFDVLSLVPGLNIIIAIVGGGTMGLFFAMNGVSVFSQKVAIRYWGRLLLEFIPFISWLPAFVWSTFAVVEWSRVEDKHAILRAAEQAVAAKAFLKKRGPVQPGKEVDSEVAALADRRAGNLEQRGGEKGAAAGAQLRNFGQDVRGMSPNKEIPAAGPGLQKSDVTPSAITKTDLARHELLNRQPAFKQPPEPATDRNVDGVNPDVEETV